MSASRPRPGLPGWSVRPPSPATAPARGSNICWCRWCSAWARRWPPWSAPASAPAAATARLRVAWTGAAIAGGLTEAIGLAAAFFPARWLSLFGSDPKMIEVGTQLSAHRRAGLRLLRRRAGAVLRLARRGPGRLGDDGRGAARRSSQPAAAGSPCKFGGSDGLFVALALRAGRLRHRQCRGGRRRRLVYDAEAKRLRLPADTTVLDLQSRRRPRQRGASRPSPAVRSAAVSDAGGGDSSRASPPADGTPRRHHELVEGDCRCRRHNRRLWKRINYCCCDGKNAAMHSDVGETAMATAKRLRGQAAQCAALAKQTHDDEGRQRYLRLEQMYSQLAKSETARGVASDATSSRPRSAPN